MPSSESEFSRALLQQIELQRKAFRNDGYPSGEVRIDRLKRAAALLIENRQAIGKVIAEDFGTRSYEQSLIADIFAPVQSLNFAIEHVSEWMQPVERAGAFPGSLERVEYVPRGVVGVVGPWNFPYHLIFEPLAGIFAAGNRAIVKPSELTPGSSALMAELAGKYFSPEELLVVQGDAAAGADFTAAPFDHIIFTGSTAVGRHVMRAAADNLTPVTLELGGKSPVILSSSADLEEAAARIMTGKTFNAGQICLAPDYVYVPEAKVDAFVNTCRRVVTAMYPEAMASADITTIISDRHFDRLAHLVDSAAASGATVFELLSGGRDPATRRFPPTLVIDPADDSEIMKEEIFGPVLPVRPYRNVQSAIGEIASRPHPLALYYFGTDEAELRRVLDGTTSGAVTVNDVVAHVLAEAMPFGGVGESGMGAYHGQTGFATFSHARGIFRQSEAAEGTVMLRPPYRAEVREFFEATLSA
jgi:coniferyl-aldehyde dehydrogenase